MEQSAAAAAVWRLRATGGHRDRDRDRGHPPARDDGDGDGDAGGKKRGGRRPLPEGRGAPLVLLYLLGLRALVHVSHRQLLSQPSAAGPREFSAPRARYGRGGEGGLPHLPGPRPRRMRRRALGRARAAPAGGQSPPAVSPGATVAAGAVCFPQGAPAGRSPRRPGPALPPGGRGVPGRRRPVRGVGAAGGSPAGWLRLSRCGPLPSAAGLPSFAGRWGLPLPSARARSPLGRSQNVGESVARAPGLVLAAP